MSEEKQEKINEGVLVEHFIDIDENIRVSIKIPKMMNAMTFKALTYKANKIFNIAQVEDQIVSSIADTHSRITRHYKKAQKTNDVWTDDALAYLKSLKDERIETSVILKTLESKYNVKVTDRQVWNKRYEVRHEGK